MARPRPKKKPERNARGQLPLPTQGQPASSSTTRVLPMQLKVGDRLVDETGEWEVTVRPYTSPRPLVAVEYATRPDGGSGGRTLYLYDARWASVGRSFVRRAVPETPC